MTEVRRPAGGDGPIPPAARAAELRAEIDRLRLENQRLVAELEDAGRPVRWARSYVHSLWRGAWNAWCVLRWNLVHVRDPKRLLAVRDQHEPYHARMLREPTKDRPRILHVVGNFHTGGSAQLIVDLTEHLGHLYEQKVLVRSLPPHPAYTGIDLIQHATASERKVTALLRSFRPNLIHVHMLGHQHDEYGKRDWSWYHEVFRAIHRTGLPVVENLNIPTEPYISDSVRCYVHVSDHVKERFGRLDGWNVTIYPGSDFKTFRRAPDQSVTDDCIGMVYRLQPDKLNEQSIEPFIAAVRGRPRTKALIVGGGQFLEQYRRRVAAAGVADAFTFTGYVPYRDLARYIGMMSVFVAPVHTESFGQVSPFAMGMELPVAGYRVGALEEIAGTADVLAPPGDAARLAEIITDLLEDRPRRLRIGEENRRRAEALFSVEAMAAQYEGVYREVLRTAQLPRKLVGVPPSNLISGSQAPAVTVLMSVFNGERFLEEAVRSILAQTLPGLEFVIVDDASTDATAAILASFDDARIRVVRNTHNLGLSRSLNIGLSQANGRYVARLDADDIAEASRLARQVAFLDAHPDVVVVGSCYMFIDEQGKETGRRWVPSDDPGIRWMLQFCSPFAHSAVMMRRTALADPAGAYDESLAYAMDYDLWKRLADRGRLANLNEFLLRWRQSPGAMTSRLGDRTERLASVTASLGAQLGWPVDDAVGNERKAALMCDLVSGATPDATIDEAQSAIRALFELHAQFCRRSAWAPETTRFLDDDLRRHTARALQWMGHRYPDQATHRFATRALAKATRIAPASLFTGEGMALALKVVTGRTVVGALRRFGRRGAGTDRPGAS